MTPKQKAYSLFAEYASRLNDGRIAKRCALIAVDEILNGISETWEVGSYDFESTNDFWQSVKKQIEKL
jgi:hypothetical protein